MITFNIKTIMKNKGCVVDNFDEFKKIMHFENDNEFYFIQILMRRKDGHHEPGINGDNSSNRLIKFYTIHSIDELDRKKDEIIKLCQMFNARAYIHPSKRDDNEIADQVLRLTTDMYLEKTYRHRMKCIYTRACGLTPMKKDKKWVVDIDTKDMDEVKRIEAIINSCRPDGSKIVTLLPTKSGYHVITRPFDLKVFKDSGGNDIDVHKNNPTLLYFEETK